MSRGKKENDVYQRVKWNGWGAKDMAMRVDENDPMVVWHPCGKKVHGLVPFINAEIYGVGGPAKKLEPSPAISPEEAIKKLPAINLNNEFMSDIRSALKESQVKTDGESRLTHIVGKNYRDLWRIRKGMIVAAPDAILLPESHEDCVALVTAAHKHNVVIIPFGGGTNVTGCVEPNPLDGKRMIASVDLRRMNRMLSIHKDSCIATFECGVLGPDLDEQLGRHNFMLGHDPDSYIHSTLGGWIAARSSGAFSNKYGDIEQMVMSMKVVTPTGVITTPTVPRAVGPDLNGVFIGSEGVFGIVTEATIKIEPVPPVKQYEGWLFPSFEAGFKAFREVTTAGLNPTCMRLYDDDETRMSFALKTEEPYVKSVISKGIKFYLTNALGYDMNKVSLCILGFEGHEREVRTTHGLVSEIFKKHNAFNVGASAGTNWQQKKYDLPYVRDFALSNTLWADVFETATVYTEALPLWRAVKEAVRGVWEVEGKKGWIGCHTAHQYKFGCCLYFTYAGQQFDDNDMEIFLKSKRAATEAMLRHKGSLTHHHGIGYEHVPWMPRFCGDGGLNLLFAMKNHMDPKNVCNPGKLLPVAGTKGMSPQALEEERKKKEMFDKMGRPSAKL